MHMASVNLLTFDVSRTNFVWRIGWVQEWVEVVLLAAAAWEVAGQGQETVTGDASHQPVPLYMYIKNYMHISLLEEQLLIKAILCS